VPQQHPPGAEQRNEHLHADVPEPGDAKPGLHRHSIDPPDRYAEHPHNERQCSPAQYVRFAGGDALGVMASASQMLILALEMVGIAYLLYALGRALGRAIWNWSKPTPTRRVTGALIAAGVVALVAF
jgi:hypothetical protein